MDVNLDESCSFMFRKAVEFQDFIKEHGRPKFVGRIAPIPDASWGNQIWHFSNDKQKLLESILGASPEVDVQWEDGAGWQILNVDRERWSGVDKCFAKEMPAKTASREEVLGQFWAWFCDHISRSLDHDLFGPEADISFTLQCWSEYDQECQNSGQEPEEQLQ